MRYFLPLLFLFVFSSCSDEDSDLNPGKGLIINEFLASNDACCSDNFGDYDDWVEFYNDSNEPIDIGGMYFTDTPDDDSPYLIPSTDPSSTTIQPGGYILLWCDDDQEQGALHVSKKLSKGGESIILLDKDGSSVITSYTYESQSTDVSMGRDPNNNESWIYFNNPTPGSVNN
jgi:hypothetical protein|tara:strand:- start:210 stop:728 length:519 start_codon:yes stop_codon:yes gene_type:complete